MFAWRFTIPARCFSGLKKITLNILSACATLVHSGQVELIGGGFYEPILISIPKPISTSKSPDSPLYRKTLRKAPERARG